MCDSIDSCIYGELNSVYDDINSIENNVTYNVLVLIAKSPITKNQIRKYIPDAWRILKHITKEGFVERIDGLFCITEDGLDEIDLIKIKYGINLY